MKKIIMGLVLAISILAYLAPAWAVDYQIFDLRNTIFTQSKEIRDLIPSSRNTVTLTSLFDSCLIAMNQIDAYFSMLGVLESFKREQASDASYDFLINWLLEIKKSNDMNIKVLDNLPVALAPPEMAAAQKLKATFLELNKRMDAELNKMALLKRATKIKRKK